MSKLPKSISPSHYKLWLTPKPSTREQLGFEEFAAKVEITVHVHSETDKFVLNSKGLNVESASFASGDLVLDGTVRYLSDLEQVVIVFDETVKEGVFGTLTLVYQGPVTTNGVGIYQNSYQSGKRMGICTQFEQCDARAMVPCWDEPMYKATFELTCTVPSFYTVLFNTDAVTVNRNQKEKTKEIVFGKTPIMSTYLLALFVGELDCISAKSASGVDIRVWTPVGEKDMGKFALDTGVKVLDYFEDFYGYRYALPKLDMVGADTFMYGGMENWGLIIYTSQYIYTSDKASQNMLIVIGYIIGHEIAHQWFGNLVTMEWWNDLWLNEGFATYAGWLATFHAFPEWKTDIELYIARNEMSKALKQDSYLDTHAVEIDASIEDPAVISTLVDAITYSKGFACLMLAGKFCGQKEFTEGVKAYIQKYAFSNAKTEDLLDCLSKASGKDVSRVIGDWISMVGYPIIRASRINDTLVLKQERFLSNGEVFKGESKPWPIPLSIFDGKTTTEVLFDTSSASFKMPPGAPFLLLDVGQTTLIRVAYSSGMWQDIVNHSAELDAVDQIGLLDSRLALAEGRFVETVDALRYAQSFFDQTSSPKVYFIGLKLVIEALGVWKQSYKGKGMRELVDDFTLTFLNRALEIVGEEAVEGESKSASELRLYCIGGLVRRGSNASIQKRYAAMLSKWREADDMLFSIILKAASSELGWDGLVAIYNECLGNARRAKLVLVAILGLKGVDGKKKFAFFKESAQNHAFQFCMSSDPKDLWEFLKTDWNWLYNALGGTANTLTRCIGHVFENQSDLKMLSEIDAWVATLEPSHKIMIEVQVKKSKECITKNNALIDKDFDAVYKLFGGLESRGRASSVPHDRRGDSTLLTVAKVGLGLALAGGIAVGIYRLTRTQE